MTHPPEDAAESQPATEMQKPPDKDWVEFDTDMRHQGRISQGDTRDQQ